MLLSYNADYAWSNFKEDRDWPIKIQSKLRFFIFNVLLQTSTAKAIGPRLSLKGHKILGQWDELFQSTSNQNNKYIKVSLRVFLHFIKHLVLTVYRGEDLWIHAILTSVLDRNELFASNHGLCSLRTSRMLYPLNVVLFGLQGYNFFCPMPPHGLVDFAVLPPGHGRSVTEGRPWGAVTLSRWCEWWYRRTARTALKPKFY